MARYHKCISEREALITTHRALLGGLGSAVWSLPRSHWEAILTAMQGCCFDHEVWELPGQFVAGRLQMFGDPVLFVSQESEQALLTLLCGLNLEDGWALVSVCDSFCLQEAFGVSLDDFLTSLGIS